MKIKLLLIVLAFQFGFSQERKCDLEIKMENLRNNPVRYQKYLLMQERFETELRRLEENHRAGVVERRATINIPVAIHYPSARNLTQPEKDCLIALAQSQVDVLNADYNALNSDLSIWTNTTSSYFPSVSVGDMDVQFQIASGTHPASTGLAAGQLAVTFGVRFGGGPDGDWDPDWAGYYNIVVDVLGGGTLGYAYLASDPADGAAVYIGSDAFGKGAGCPDYVPGSPYNLGRTLTHEAGHYLNLEHIWGNGTCGNDFVADTPQHNTSNGGCPPISHLSTCAGTPRELTMNYMDYTYDQCMYMFTAGQAARMQAHMNTIVSNFNQTTLSNANFEFQNSITLFPNPNKGSFKLQVPLDVSIYDVEVMDSSGRIVFTNSYSKNIQDINLNIASSGVYLIKIKSKNAIAYKKLIVE